MDSRRPNPSSVCGIYNSNYCIRNRNICTWTGNPTESMDTAVVGIMGDGIFCHGKSAGCVGKHATVRFLDRPLLISAYVLLYMSLQQ